MTQAGKRNEGELNETNPMLPGDNLDVIVGKGFVTFHGNENAEWIHAETGSVVIVEDKC
jgi:hypothetical protein